MFMHKQPHYFLPVLWNDLTKLITSGDLTSGSFKHYVKSCIHCEYNKCSGCQQN